MRATIGRFSSRTTGRARMLLNVRDATGISTFPAALDHHHLGARLNAVTEIGHVLVAQSDAAGGDLGADRPRIVRAVDAVERRAEIGRARAERIVRSAL